MAMLHGRLTNDYHEKSIEQVILDGLKNGPMCGKDIYSLFQFHIRKAQLKPVLEKMIMENKILVSREKQKYIFELYAI